MAFREAFCFNPYVDTHNKEERSNGQTRASSGTIGAQFISSSY